MTTLENFVGVEWALLGPKIDHSAVLILKSSFPFLECSASLSTQLPASVTKGAPPAKLFTAWLSLPSTVLTCALKRQNCRDKRLYHNSFTTKELYQCCPGSCNYDTS